MADTAYATTRGGANVGGMMTASQTARMRPANIVRAAIACGLTMTDLARRANVGYEAVARNRPMLPDEIDRLQSVVDEAKR